MKTYWDYSEKERAALGEQWVRDLLDYELMAKGVLKVLPPKHETVAEVTLEKQQVFGITCKGQYGSNTRLEVVFSSIDAATAFLALKPLLRIERYQEPTHLMTPSEMAIAPEELATEAAVLAASSAIKENADREYRNTRSSQEYEAAQNKADEATKDIWNDWRECQDTARRCQTVIDTFEEYKRLTNGDEAIARTFLGKSFRQDELEEAWHWFGLDAPPESKKPQAVPTPEAAGAMPF